MLSVGKVRIRLVKRVARQLLDSYPQLFTRDFESNKQVVSKLISTRSKKLRNQIAGYITHLVAVRSREKRVETVEEPVS
ncbi:30S ribosomal protein S17e [Thermogladius calderae 1633]|uniref:Small ribosomal subunit protein eS17 n=1 Tax=Thermogladius calderae (strain DSM 22663 / VKM B-2946 / 1633) TaxID=1184251 RepID=I3TD55_THEC1|nr:30S ribosomal protein S17e [Thermogladius calderae 1633]